MSATFSTSYTFNDATSSSTGCRVYLVPGLNGSPSDYGSGILLSLTQGLQALGHQVVFIGIPAADSTYYSSGGGRDYRNGWKAALQSIVSNVNSDHGAPRRNILGGISFGGLHSMLGFVTSRVFDGWFASLTVTRIDALQEFPSVGDVDSFNPFKEGYDLLHTTGFLSWGTADTRVNYQLTKSLAASVSCPTIATKEYVGTGHTTTSDQITDLLSWAAVNG